MEQIMGGSTQYVMGVDSSNNALISIRSGTQSIGFTDDSIKITSHDPDDDTYYDLETASGTTVVGSFATIGTGSYFDVYSISINAEAEAYGQYRIYVSGGSTIMRSYNNQYTGISYNWESRIPKQIEGSAILMYQSTTGSVFSSIVGKNHI